MIQNKFFHLCPLLRPKGKWITFIRSVSSTNSLNVQESLDIKPTAEAVKPFSEIPGPKGWPIIGTTLPYMQAEKGTLHKLIDQRFEEYGPIFKETGLFKVVFIKDPDAAQQMLKYEGKYPQRIEILAWKMYRKDKGVPQGVLLSEDEEWQRCRSALNRHMMRPHSVAQHTDDFNDVVKDFIESLEQPIFEGNGILSDLPERLFRWSLESFCMVIFEERLGCISPSPPPDSTNFIEGIQEVLKTTEKLIMFPPKLAKALGLKAWKDHVKHWDIAYTTGAKFVQKKMRQIQEDLSAGKEVSGLIATLMLHSDMSEADIIADAVNLMGGAVDTTSSTILWTLYTLSKNPDKLKILQQEIASVLPSSRIAGQQELQDMHYLKAVVKETLRLYPVAGFVSRIMKEDAVIHGYSLPKGTLVELALYSMGKNPKIYKDPLSFKPERWLRHSSEEEDIHPFANLNFGHGARACIGRRVAELEIHLLICRLLQQYDIANTCPETEVDSSSQILLVPKGPINVMFKKRNL